MGIKERKEREFQRREREILAAANTLILSEDWSGVTIDRIAELAEIGKGTVYKHFKSKDEVYARLLVNHNRGLLEELQRIDPELELPRRIGLVAKTFWHYHMGTKEYQRLAQYCEREGMRCTLGEETRAEIEANENGIIAFVLGLIREGIDSGFFVDKQPAFLLMSGWGALLGSMHLLWNPNFSRKFEGLDIEAYLDFLIGTLLKGWMKDTADGPVG